MKEISSTQGEVLAHRIERESTVHDSGSGFGERTDRSDRILKRLVSPKSKAF